MRTVFFDIDTQLDFLVPAGALYVPGAERLIPAIALLNQRAPVVVSTTDAHAENDPEFRDWPGHCVAGTWGQRKPAATLLEPRVVIANRPADLDVEGARQIILEKQALDAFTNPNLARLLGLLAADRYVVYGVVTEYCVSCAALGLLRTGKPVSLVADAIQALDPAAAERTLAEFRQQGGRLETIETVCGS